MEMYFAHMLGHLGISPFNPLIQDSVRYWLLVFRSLAVYIHIDDLNHVLYGSQSALYDPL